MGGLQWGTFFISLQYEFLCLLHSRDHSLPHHLEGIPLPILGSHGLPVQPPPITSRPDFL